MNKRKSSSPNIVVINFNLEKWLTGSIALEKYDTKGVFIDLCAFYGYKNCVVTMDEVNKRFDNHPALERLKGRFYKIGIDGYIKIKYVDEEISDKVKKRILLSRNGKLGAIKTNEIKKTKKQAPTPITKPELLIKSATPEKKKVVKTPKEDLEQRKKKFAESLKPFLEKYGREMLNEFYKYWTEPLIVGNGNRFRQETEKAWDVALRLEKWYKNNYDKLGVKMQKTLFEGNKPIYKPQLPAPEGETLEQVEKRIALILKNNTDNLINTQTNEPK